MDELAQREQKNQRNTPTVEYKNKNLSHKWYISVQLFCIPSFVS